MEDEQAQERIECAAAVDLWHAAPPPVRDALGLDVREVAGVTCFACRDLQPALIFRRVVGLGLDRPAAPADIDAVVRHMDGFGQPWTLALAPFAQPPTLSEDLLARGFTPAYRWMKFSRRCDTPLPSAATDLRVRAFEAAEGEAFAAVVAAGFGLPATAQPWLAALPGRARWVCLGAFDGAAAVATGAVFVDGDHAWLGFAATLDSHRRRGAQGALLAARLDAAARHGARVAVTETGERVPDKPSRSYRNILRAGFEEAYLRAHFAAPARAA